MIQLRTATPTARKPHFCDWCHTTIAAGETYNRSTNVYDDRLYDWIACRACEAIATIVWEWAYRPDEGIGEDSFMEWANEHRNDATHGTAAMHYLARRGVLAPDEGSRDE